MSFKILGIGTALPENWVQQSRAAEWAIRAFRPPEQQAARLRWLYARSGVERRHMVFPQDAVEGVFEEDTSRQSAFLPTGEPDDEGPTTAERLEVYNIEAPRLAVDAARSALEDARLRSAEITHLVTVSCTGFAAPGVDIALIDQLQLPATTQRAHVGFMGCHGALNGLRVARGLAAAEPAARVLLCSVELCSLHYHYGWSPEKLVANALFADGAAAVVVGRDEPRSDADAWQIAAGGSCLLAESRQDMTWRIGDHGFEMTLSIRVPKLIHEHLRPWMSAWLDRHGFALDQIRSWAVHPGGPKILTAVEQALDLDEQETSVSRDVLRDCGNMSSATSLFIIERLVTAQAARPCVALGFGPGLMAEAVLFE